MPKTEIITMFSTFTDIVNNTKGNAMNAKAIKRWFIVWAVFYNLCILITCVFFRNENMDNAIMYATEILPPPDSSLGAQYYNIFNIIKFGGLIVNFLILLLFEARTKISKQNELKTIAIMLPLSIIVFVVFWNKIILCVLDGWLLFMYCFVRMHMYGTLK